jgi:hypothetical protein
MKKFLILGLLIGLCVFAYGSSRDKEPSADDVLRMMSKAVQGDGDAAYDLFIYCSATRSRTGEEGLEWLIRGVRLGDDESISAYRTLQKDGVIEKLLHACLETGVAIQEKRQKEWDDFNAK